MKRFVVALGLAIAPAVAHAETPAWSVGVTDAQKAQAQKMLDAGNALFVDNKYAEALGQYRSAVAQWDHPAIRFNIVRCLIQLDKNVEAAENLALALKYGKAPLEDNVYTEAVAYQKLLEGRVASIEASCAQTGVKLTLDGQPLANCPAKETRQVEPGTHQLVGVKQGFLTRTVEVIAFGGKHEAVTLSLEPLEKAARIEHRWPQWMPWAVFGGGLAIAGVGGLLDLSAASMMDDYDKAVARECPNRACTAADLGADANKKSDAESRSHLAIGVVAVGGAAAVTGAVLLYLNRGRTVYPDSVERLTPSVTPTQGGAALTLGGRF